MQTEIGQREQDILQALFISSWQSKPHHQQQNLAERKYQMLSPPWAWGKTASYPSAWQAGKVDLMPLVARQLLLSDWVARQGLKTAGRRIHGSPWSSEASTWCPVQVLRVSKPPDMRCTFPSWCEEIVLEPPTLGLNPPFYPNGVIMTAWANHLRP